MKKDKDSLTETQATEEVKVLNDRQPFNDVGDYFNKVQGATPRNSNAKISSLPKPIRYIGYFMFICFAIAIILSLIMNLLD